MASNTKKTKARRKARKLKMGRRRKAKQGVASTPSTTDLFAACGEPGKPAPAAQ